MKFISTLFLLSLMTSMTAQTTPQKYYDMLDGMYRNTVPLGHPEEVEPDGLVFLDTREAEEYAVSHIPGARLVPYNGFKVESLEAIPKDAPIVVYCSVGYRSERIGEKLLEAGYTNVHNLYGGIFNWYFEGGELVNMNNDSTDRIHTYNKKWSKWCLKGEKVW